MAKFVKVNKQWINLDRVMWVEEDGTNYKVVFEKSTILVASKLTGGMALLEVLDPPPVGEKEVVCKKNGKTVIKNAAGQVTGIPG